MSEFPDLMIVGGIAFFLGMMLGAELLRRVGIYKHPATHVATKPEAH